MATRVKPRNERQPIILHFPAGGIDLSRSLEEQPPREIAPGVYARTTPIGQNVRGQDNTRGRGAQRPGLSRFIKNPLDADWLVQQLDLIVSVNETPPGGNMQESNSGRVVTLVAVSQGDIFVANAGDTDWTTTTNSTSPLDTPPLNYTGLVQSTVLNQVMYFADGVNRVKYTPSTNVVSTWTATAGSFPVDSDSNTSRLICTWRGRIVHAGLLLDSHNYFMSAVDDAGDYNYSAAGSPPTMALAGDSAPQGLVGDVITSLCPYSDDRLIMFCDHEIWQFSGDPFYGGTLDNISRSIGGTWGICWCVGPAGEIYFMSNRMGVFVMIPGQKPQWISQQIDQYLQDIDSGESTIRLIWDDRYKGLHVFVSTTAEPGLDDTHFFFEQRTGAWWTDKFGNKKLNPLCCCVFDGNEPTDRVALIGSWDGFVRTLDPDAEDDDGTPIESEVVFGPILTENLDDMMLDDFQAILSKGSEDVEWAVYVGDTAEEAIASSPVQEETLTAGRNFTSPIGRAGHAVYGKISGTKPWAVESLRANVRTLGPIRRRGKG